MKLSKTTSTFLVLSLLLLFVSVHQAAAQSEWEGRWFYFEKTEPVWFESQIDKKDADEVMARWDKIRKELHANDIEGIYGTGGDTHTSYFAVSEKYGFVQLSINLCQASVHKVRYGDVRIVGEKMTFYPLSGSKRAGDPHSQNNGLLSFEMIRAKWRNIDYLVGEDEVAKFCDGIAGIDSPVARPYYFENWFYGKGEEKGSAYDLPILPANYQYLIKKPINGKVTGVGKRIIQRSVWDEPSPGEKSEDITYQSVTSLTLDIGSDNGIKEGMQLFVLVPNECCAEDIVEITKVSKNSAAGIVTRQIGRNPGGSLSKLKDDDAFKPLQIGQIVTTSGYISSEYMLSLNKDH